MHVSFPCSASDTKTPLREVHAHVLQRSPLKPNCVHETDPPTLPPLAPPYMLGLHKKPQLSECEQLIFPEGR